MSADQVHTLFLHFQREFRAGHLDDAERLVHERIAVIGEHADSADLARAYTNLGLVRFFRNDLDGAEDRFTAALEMDQRLNHERGIARSMGNLALVPEARGDLDRAEALNRASLAIAERIGDDDIAAGKLANLGDIALRRGRTEDARGLWTRALTLFERNADEKHAAEVRGKVAGLDTHS